MTTGPLVRVMVNRGCAHCVGALDRVAELAGRFGVSVAAVDVAAHPRAAADRDVRSSPALLVDDDLAYVGVPDPSTFAALVGATHPGDRRGRRSRRPLPGPHPQVSPRSHPQDVRPTYKQTEDHT